MPGQREYTKLLQHHDLFKIDNPALYYSIQKMIGQGGYGKIYLVTRKNEEPVRYYALKFVNRPMDN